MEGDSLEVELTLRHDGREVAHVTGNHPEVIAVSLDTDLLGGKRVSATGF